MTTEEFIKTTQPIVDLVTSVAKIKYGEHSERFITVMASIMDAQARKDDPPLMLERGGYPSGGSYTHNWYLVEDGDEYISDNDYDLVELLVRAIERIYKNE